MKLPRPEVHLLPLVMVSTLGYQLFGWLPAALASHVLLAAYVLSQWPQLTRVPRTLLTLATMAILTLPWLSVDPAGSLLLALNRAAYFATFLAALSFLREAAETSPLVRRCGDVTINQPPGMRYATLSSGSFLIGILLNMAVLNLLGVMVRRANTLAAAGGNAAIQQIRNRRMFTAMIRGFSVIPLGSPLTITLALILSIVPGVRWWQVLPYGWATMLLILLLGWAWDRAVAPRHLAGQLPAARPPAGAAWDITRFLLLVLAIFSAAVVVELALGIDLPLAILLTAPAAAIAWMTVQRSRRGVGRAVVLTGARLLKGAERQFSGMRAEVSVLCAAGLLGTLIAAVVPTTAFADFLGLMGLQGPVIGVLLVVLMVALSQIGLNPILVATIGLSSLAQPELFGLAPEMLALSVMAGWTLAIGCSPVTTSILIASRMAGVSPQTAGWSWNGWYTLGATAVMVAWLLLLGWLFF
ncbi:MAG: hypothetical protein JJT90_12640 [Ectothiorhodospiraceae bacterium]|nr:hypothetical protein [Ectothiorhodospiraceae bacterium]